MILLTQFFCSEQTSLSMNRDALVTRSLVSLVRLFSILLLADIVAIAARR